MILFIYICIIALNAVAILMTYHFLGEGMDKKTKGIFIVVGIATIYVLVSLVYGLTTINTEKVGGMDNAKNLIVFTFVPANAIIILPFAASSYKHLKNGRLKKVPFRNRCILLGCGLIILLVIEFFYFKNLQVSILSML